MKTALYLTATLLSFLPTGLFADNFDWSSPGNNLVGHYYVSPYKAKVKGTGEVLTLYCIDFNHEVAPPNEWTAVINPLDHDDVPNLQYGNSAWGAGDPAWSDTWTKYEKAAWLIDQLSRVSPLDAAGRYQQGVYQYAAWKIFLDAAHTPAFDQSVAAVGGTFSADIANAYTAAQSAVDGGYAPTGWAVVTPDPRGLSGSTQEFLVDPPPVPEPSSVVLLATALSAAAFLMRRRYVSGRPDSALKNKDVRNGDGRGLC